MLRARKARQRHHKSDFFISPSSTLYPESIRVQGVFVCVLSDCPFCKGSAFNISLFCPHPRCAAATFSESLSVPCSWSAWLYSDHFTGPDIVNKKLKPFLCIDSVLLFSSYAAIPFHRSPVSGFLLCFLHSFCPTLLFLLLHRPPFLSAPVLSVTR